MQRRFETGEITALADITEESIENLLDLAEVALDFLGDLADQQFFLCLARHLVEQRNFGVCLRHLAGNAAVDPGNGNVYLVREIAAQTQEILLRILREEQAGGHFH